MFGGLKLLGDFLGCERVIDAVAAISKLLDLGEGAGATLLLGDDNVDVDLVLGGDRLLHLLARSRGFIDQFAEHDIAHGKAERRHRNRTVAELLDQVVVAATAGDGAKFACAIEHFENDTGVVGESTNNPDIDIDKIGQPAAAQTVDKPLKFLAFAAFTQNGEYRIGQLAKFCPRIFQRLATGLIDDLQQFVPAIRRNILLAQEIGPKFAVANSDDEIFFCETEHAQEIDAKSEQLDIRRGRGFPNDIAIELEMFA